MDEQGAAGWILVLGEGKSKTFQNLDEIAIWMGREVESWKSFFVAGHGVPDSLLAHIMQGVGEHLRDWETALSKFTGEVASEDIQVRLNGVRESISSYNLILSSSQLGARILASAEEDSIAAGLAVCMTTGRNLTAILGDARGRSVWRLVPRLAMCFGTTDAKLSGEIAVLTSQGRELLHEAEALRTRTSADLVAAIRSANEQAIQGESRFSELLSSATAKTEQQLGKHDQEWKELRDTYDSKLALASPLTYWRSRKRWAYGQAAVWGVVFLLVGGLAAAKFFPWVHATLAGRFVGGRSLTAFELLPEIALLGALAFMLLWVLRFAARESSKGLAIAQDSAMRVTMVNTFLALSNPSEGRASLVSEADRALILSALFRPAPGGADDAPPSHWIEDVLARLKDKPG